MVLVILASQDRSLASSKTSRRGEVFDAVLRRISPVTVLVPASLGLQILQRHIGWHRGPDSANFSRCDSAPFQRHQ